MSIWEDYQKKQDQAIHLADIRRMTASSLRSHSDFLATLSDTELRLRILKSRLNDPIVEKFNAAYWVVHNNCNHSSVTQQYARVDQELMGLAEKYTRRAMTEEEFNFVNSRSPAALISDLYKKSTQGTNPPVLEYNETDIIQRARSRYPF